MVRVSHEESSMQTLETIPENDVLTPLSQPSSTKRKRSNNPSQLKFTSTEAHSKYHQMKKHVFTGNSINFQNHLKALALLKSVNLDTFVTYHNQLVYYQQVGEFFCNMASDTHLNGKEFFTTSVTGRTLLIDEIVLCEFLNLPSEVLELPHFEDSEFNLKDFHEYLKVLCGCEVPIKLFELESVMCFEYFTPTVQLLALIFRSNIAPKINSGKFFQWFTFSELKFLHSVITKSFKFNVPHLLMTSFVKANLSGYLAFGLLLTDLFQHFSINLTGKASFNITATILDSQVVTTMPLAQFTPYSKAIVKMVSPQTDESKNTQELHSKVLALEENQHGSSAISEDLDKRLTALEEVVAIIKRQKLAQLETKSVGSQMMEEAQHPESLDKGKGKAVD